MRNMPTQKITKASAMITAIVVTLKNTLNVVATAAVIRPLVVVLLVLGFFAAVWIGSPFTAERVTAASPAAIPAPSPPDQEEIDTLVESLKGTLADSIDDEDAVNSIVEKWEVRALARKTKKQIITTLFTDVKAVVRDKETQDAVWESWSEMIAEADAEEPARPAPSKVKPKPTPEETEEAESAEPTAPPARVKLKPTAKAVSSVDEPTEKGIDAPTVDGRWTLTDDLKQSSGETEMAFFRSSYNTVRTWHSEPRQYKGQHYSISIPTDPIDKNAQSKAAGVDKAIKTVVDNGFVLPFDLQFYFSPVDGTWTQAFKRGKNWAPVAYVFLGPGGSTKALSYSAAGFNGFDTRTIRAIHEIGHIIHERQAGDSFWESGRTPNGSICAQVTEYSCGNEKEFVAEVFTGIVIGKRWSNEVLAEYRKFLGPRPTIF